MIIIPQGKWYMSTEWRKKYIQSANTHQGSAVLNVSTVSLSVFSSRFHWNGWHTDTHRNFRKVKSSSKYPVLFTFHNMFHAYAHLFISRRVELMLYVCERVWSKSGDLLSDKSNQIFAQCTHSAREKSWPTDETSVSLPTFISLILFVWPTKKK